MPYKNPEVQRAYKRRWQQQQRARTRGTPGGTLTALNPPLMLRQAEDVVRLLEQEINQLRATPGMRPEQRARLIAQLAKTCLAAIEARSADRFEAIHEEFERRGTA